MPNKTPSYKDKVLKEFDEEFDGSLWSDPDELAIPKYREVNDFIVRALEEQMKLVMECIGEKTARYDKEMRDVDDKVFNGRCEASDTGRNNHIDNVLDQLKSKGLI